MSCRASFAADASQPPPAQTSQTKDYLTFGFLPMQSPVSLFKRFAPFRDYLSTQIQKEIRLESAKDFQVFSTRTQKRYYDIVFTAPHMVLQALDGRNYEIAATSSRPLKSVIVVKDDSEIQSVQALEGKTIATPPKQAIVTMVGMAYLSGQGINAARFKEYLTHNAAYSAVLGGEADAAMIANFIALKVIKNNLPLKIVAQSNPFPGIGILLARDLPDTLKKDIKTAIWGMNKLPNGKKVLENISQPGYVEAHKSQFEILRPYLKGLSR